MNRIHIESFPLLVIKMLSLSLSPSLSLSFFSVVFAWAVCWLKADTTLIIHKICFAKFNEKPRFWVIKFHFGECIQSAYRGLGIALGTNPIMRQLTKQMVKNSIERTLKTMAWLWGYDYADANGPSTQERIKIPKGSFESRDRECRITVNMCVAG